MAASFRVHASTGIHKGDRDYQQDQVCILQHLRHAGCLMAIVADGMGGRSGGRKASDQVMLTARQLFERYSLDHDDPVALLRQIVTEAHLVIKLTAVTAEQEPHSTVAAMLLHPNGECHWIHAGDSRIYHFRHGQLVRRTRDHSYVQLLVDKGQLTEAQAESHPKSNVLTGCLGGETDPPLDAVHHIHQLIPGDVLMACSDGLWHYFSAEELGSALHSLYPREACEFLIQKARGRAGGRGDNLSLAVIRIEALQ